VVAVTDSCGEDVGSVVLRQGGIECENTCKLSVVPNFAPFRAESVNHKHIVRSPKFRTFPCRVTNGPLSGLVAVPSVTLKKSYDTEKPEICTVMY
jgi:hypothetical protein